VESVLIVDVPIHQPVPVRTTPISRPPTISSVIFPHTPGHDPSRNSWSSVDGPLDRLQQSPEPMMTAIPEHPEEGPTTVPTPIPQPQPAIPRRREVPLPLPVAIPEPEQFVDRGRQRGGSGSESPFDVRGLMGDPSRHLRTSTTSEQIELASLQSQAAHFNGWPHSPQGEFQPFQPPSSPNSYTGYHNGNGTYAPGSRVCG
jgi:hypothetical protein